MRKSCPHKNNGDSPKTFLNFTAPPQRISIGDLDQASLKKYITGFRTVPVILITGALPAVPTRLQYLYCLRHCFFQFHSTDFIFRNFGHRINLAICQKINSSFMKMEGHENNPRGHDLRNLHFYLYFSPS